VYKKSLSLPRRGAKRPIKQAIEWWKALDEEGKKAARSEDG
jgi:hypothetical protein